MIFATATDTKDERLAKINILKESLLDAASKLKEFEESQEDTIPQRRQIAEELRGYLDRWNVLARGTYSEERQVN